MRRCGKFCVVSILFLSSITLPVFGSGGYKTDAQHSSQLSPFTTVFVLRHADRDEEGNLTELGKTRALDLVHVVGSSGVKAIYTTDIARTKGTIQPLATSLGIKPEFYWHKLKELRRKVMSMHKGEAVLIVGHDTNVEDVIETFIGHKIDRNIGVQFDDIHIVTIDPSGRGSVLSIKYGKQVEQTESKNRPMQMHGEKKRDAP
jgi:broad specificity phosphatase PhoE